MGYPKGFPGSVELTGGAELPGAGTGFTEPLPPPGVVPVPAGG
jgi:hypothetical protein